MEISARNQLPGEITETTIDGVSAEVTINVGCGIEVPGVITRGSVERLGLDMAVGDH